MKESEAMKEIRMIRDRHYEETKGMTRAEYIKSIKERAARSRLKAMNTKTWESNAFYNRNPSYFATGTDEQPRLNSNTL